MLKKFSLQTNPKITLLILLVYFLFSVIVYQDESRGQETDMQEVVEYLIHSISTSHLIFIRNGERYSNDEAAEHIRRKYGYFKSKIKTPQDFIFLCASKSLMSGEPYMVDTPKGRIPVEKWLWIILREHMQKRNHMYGS